MTPDSQKFAIFRIVGNSLPPRHSADSALRSTRYILENEDEFGGCEKLWVLNKIVDRGHKQSLIDLLRQKNHRFVDIPFDADAHFNSYLDVTGAPVALRFALNEQTVLPHIAFQLEEWRIRHKSQALIGINEARNVALEYGRIHFDWSVIADGGVIFSKQGWSNFVQGTELEPQRKIAILPMYRIYEWKPLDEFAPDGTQEEPQIAFHRTSEEVFDPALRYGYQNKAELIARLGVEGPWQKWRTASWEIRNPLPAPNFKNFIVAGFVYRLPTDGAVEETFDARFASRFRGVQSLSFSADLTTAQRRRDLKAELLPRLPQTVDDNTRIRIEKFVKPLLVGPDSFVTSKSVLGPSGNPNDYFSLGPTQASAPIKQDSSTTDAEKLGVSGDAEAFSSFAWRVCACATAGVLLNRSEFKQRAADLLEAWFVDPRTKMNPTARYAQRIPGTNTINKNWVIELRHLANIVSMVRLLQYHGVLDARIVQLMKNWAEQFLDDCQEAGIREKSLQRNNNVGTWAAVLFGSLDLFCDRHKESFSIVHQASERLGQQIGPFSVQLHEIGGEKPLHNCLFNLGAWFSLYQLCRDFGVDLFKFTGVHDESLNNALEFCFNNKGRHRDYQSSPGEYDAWIDVLRRVYQNRSTRNVVLVPTVHWGLPPFVSG